MFLRIQVPEFTIKRKSLSHLIKSDYILRNIRLDLGS
nr:MAG TPA: hypothetical protein [Caudoviricetes sp.]